MSLCIFFENFHFFSCESWKMTDNCRVECVGRGDILAAVTWETRKNCEVTARPHPHTLFFVNALGAFLKLY